MYSKEVSIKMIAEDLQISISTVSRALNGKPGVSEGLKERIVKRAHEMGYDAGKRNTDSESFSDSSLLNRKNIIAMIVGDIRNPFYADLVFVVQKRLNELGYLLSVFNSEYNAEEELRCLRFSEAYNFAGIIQVTVSSEKMSFELKNLSLPVVMVNRMISSFDTDFVLLDNFEAGYLAARHLIELGHSRIGFLKGQPESSSSQLRYDGFITAMSNYNLEVLDKDIFQGDLSMETAYSIGREFAADMSDRPSAMIMSNDLSAYGFISCCTEMGVQIPSQLSVVSFDNIRFFSISNIPLTTINPHVEEMGRIAAELMVNRIKYPNKRIEKIILSPELIEGKTTAFFSRK